ncbi:MAG: DUF58 domain-containing protein [Eubacteriales bacterium]|nr:DUF58 domain-containing protein [Eubacteriales bacterium]
MLSDAFLARLDALSLPMRERARGAAGGARRSRALGSSAEFSDFRAHAPGDDPRRIDWNAYARFDRLFVKLFMEEQDALLTVLLDVSASMEGGKCAAAVKAAETLIYLALIGGDRARVVALTDKDAVSPIFAGRAAFARASAFLAAIRPEGALRLNQRVPRVRLPPCGVTALIGDYLSEDGYDRAIQSLTFRGQSPLLVQVLSAEELSPALSGAVRLIDAEGADALELVADHHSLAAYDRALQALLGDLGRQAHRCGAPYALLNADEDFESAALAAMVRAGLIA